MDKVEISPAFKQEQTGDTFYDDAAFGEFVKDLCHEKGLVIDNRLKATGLSPQTVLDIQNGNLEHKNFASIRKLLAYLGKKVFFLIQDDEK